MEKKIRISVSPGVKTWLARQNLNDNERAEACAKKLGEVILAWECLRTREWVDTRELALAIGRPFKSANDPNSRHVRRLMKKLHATGLVDMVAGEQGGTHRPSKVRMALFMKG